VHFVGSYYIGVITMHGSKNAKPVDVLYGNISNLMNSTKRTDTLFGKKEEFNFTAGGI
jgi:hypothetical protein